MPKSKKTDRKKLNASNKTENRFENEGENEFPGAEQELKPRQTKSQTYPENEK